MKCFLKFNKKKTIAFISKSSKMKPLQGWEKENLPLTLQIISKFIFKII